MYEPVNGNIQVSQMHTHNIIKTEVSSISVSTTNKSEHKTTVVCSGYVCVIHELNYYYQDFSHKQVQTVGHCGYHECIHITINGHVILTTSYLTHQFVLPVHVHM